MKTLHNKRNTKETSRIPNPARDLYGEHYTQLAEGIVKRRVRAMHTSHIVLLGGKHLGEKFLRYIPPTSFNAWKKAHAVGIPVEPIIGYSKKYMKFNKFNRLEPSSKSAGGVSFFEVRTGVLHGQNVLTFLENEKNHRHIASIKTQTHDIFQRLAEQHIDHGHPHASNFVVVMESGKPTVYLVQFNSASIKTHENILLRARQSVQDRLLEDYTISEQLLNRRLQSIEKKH
jgi:hypothetical protein